MKYVGATDWFIRWPFILEGMTLGFFGALIANFVINGTYAALLSRIYATLAFLPMVPAYPMLTYVDISIILAGTAIGAAGSYISLRKFKSLTAEADYAKKESFNGCIGVDIRCYANFAGFCK